MKRDSLFAYRGVSSGRADLTLAVCAFVGFIGIWYGISLFEFVPQRFLPLPHHVVVALWGMFVERNFIEDVWISVARVWTATSPSMVSPVFMSIGTCPLTNTQPSTSTAAE